MWQQDVHIAIWELRCRKNRGEGTVGKNSIEVIINKKVYQLSGSESDDWYYIDKQGNRCENQYTDKDKTHP